MARRSEPKSKTARRGLTRRRLLATASGGAAAAMIVPGPFNILRAQERPIRVGFPTPLTGPYGTEAQDQVRAAQVAIAEFNEAGGLDGRQAELLVRDSKLNPGEAVTRTLELIENNDVDFIVGGLSASVQLSINNVTKARKIVFNSISQSDVINEASDWSRYTFHEALNPHMTAGAVGRYAFPKFGKRIAFLTADYAYGHEMVRGFQRAGEAFGVETVADIRHPLGTTDYSTFLPRIQALQPDIVCFCNFGRDQQLSIKQASDFGMKQMSQFITPILLYTARLAGGAQPYEGVVGGTSYYWKLEDQVASSKAFNDKFREMHKGAVPSDYGSYGYAGVRTVLEACRNAGTTESDAVVEALRALKYDFYKGPQYYRACDHQSVQSVLIIELKSEATEDSSDVFNIVHIDPPDEKNLRSCEELGHEA